jgi:hypothetical protein
VIVRQQFLLSRPVRLQLRPARIALHRTDTGNSIRHAALRLQTRIGKISRSRAHSAAEEANISPRLGRAAIFPRRTSRAAAIRRDIPPGDIPAAVTAAAVITTDLAWGRGSQPALGRLRYSAIEAQTLAQIRIPVL